MLRHYKGLEFSAGLRVARRYRTARARIAALELHFADAEAHDAALIGAEEAIFPEGRQGTVRRRPLGGCSFRCVYVRHRRIKKGTGVPWPYNAVGTGVNF